MRRFLLDTNIAGAYVSRKQSVIERVHNEVSKGNRIGIGVPVLAELYYGIERSASRDRNLQRLRLALPSLTIWPFTDIAAAEYGRIAADLRRIGRPMQTIDMMIAAIATTLGNCTVVSKDGDLADVPGLPVENWTV